MMKYAFHLLIVEDDEQVKTWLKLCLEGFASDRVGFIVDTATTAEEGLDRIKEGLAPNDTPSVQALLLDLHLPNGEGLATLDRFRVAYPDLPIVVVSGQEYPDHAVYEHGARWFLAKPISREQLQEAVAEVIGYVVSSWVFKGAETKLDAAKEVGSRAAELVGAKHPAG